MRHALTELQEALAQEPAVLVRVAQTQGSAPRETGAWIAVSPTHVTGSIGGGHLEFDAIAQARTMLAGATVPTELQRVALGPSMGQCCGGVVFLRYALLGPQDAAGLAQRLQAPAAPVALFGGGHVGQAIARQLAHLPFALHWIDSRDEIFPADTPAHIRCEHSDPVQAAVADIAPGSSVLIMSFSHAEDLEILAQCLLRARRQNDLPYIGLIGSKSKWATFRHRLEARGFNEGDFARVTCPIGVPGIAGKQPEVIAVAVAAQLLQRLPG
ncbi:xanthine dehydrogenase accessory protein XdhC [Rhodoferax sp. BAB1]|uniref:xanthine dehydrogenase accessory protein XdhC n=1 Tax=Rhodoferax sp. BAB1 TaxID=2741720 RepID=UPI001575C3B5|nr:xanthine dehydrogenase accessory protein XdhC [Rhodoferax sp. BAB1]QKO23542.1 xanthine dehydrogenase accessory protein XdhC [Rhodoferax sp. BAB1]